MNDEDCGLRLTCGLRSLFKGWLQKNTVLRMPTWLGGGRPFGYLLK